MVTVTERKMQQVYGSTAAWAASTRILMPGEIGIEDLGPGIPPKIKAGDGINLWANLQSSSGATISRTTLEWSASTAVLASGEIGYDSDTKEIRVGDGVSLWADLTNANGYQSDEALVEALLAAAGGDEGVDLGLAITTAVGRRDAPARLGFLTDLVEALGANKLIRVNASGDIDGVELNTLTVVADRLFGTDSLGGAKQYTFAEIIAKLDEAREVLELTPSGDFTIDLLPHHVEVHIDPTANCNLTAVTGLKAGQPITVFFTQPVAGNVTLSTAVGINKMSADANAVDLGASVSTLLILTRWRDGSAALRKAGTIE